MPEQEAEQEAPQMPQPKPSTVESTAPASAELPGGADELAEELQESPALDGEVIGSRKYAGLRPAWQPGESGNPAGRKRTTPATDLIRDLLAAGDAELAVAELRRLAFGAHGTGKGKKVQDSTRLAALTYLLNKAEGMPVQQVAVDDDAAQLFNETAARLMAAIVANREAAALAAGDAGEAAAERGGYPLR